MAENLLSKYFNNAWTPQVPKATPFSVTNSVMRSLPGGDTYKAPTVTPAPIAPVTPKSLPVAPQTPVAPVETPQTQKGNIPPQFINPSTGTLYSPQEFAANVSKIAPSGSIANYAGEAIKNAGKETVAGLTTVATGLNNQRNDIATGTTDPYNIASKSGIAYSPAELSAIEKAYAGIYDPALTDVFTKLETKQKEAESALQLKNELAKMEQEHKYAMEEKQTPTYADLHKATALSGGAYVPGSDANVEAMAEQILNGKATMANVPKEYKMVVASAMQNYGNQADGKPTTTEMGKKTLSVAKELLTMYDKGEGTSVQGKSRLFGLGFATPGSASADFYSKYDQLKGLKNLDAAKFLKGQGQVSDAERALLQQAATSLALNQSGDLFRKDLTGIISSLEGNLPGKGEEKPSEMQLPNKTVVKLQADGTYQ